jgi:hypothetical protein
MKRTIGATLLLGFTMTHPGQAQQAPGPLVCQKAPCLGFVEAGSPSSQMLIFDSKWSHMNSAMTWIMTNVANASAANPSDASMMVLTVVKTDGTDQVQVYWTSIDTATLCSTGFGRAIAPFTQLECPKN